MRSVMTVSRDDTKRVVGRMFALPFILSCYLVKVFLNDSLTYTNMDWAKQLS